MNCFGDGGYGDGGGDGYGYGTGDGYGDGYGDARWQPMALAVAKHAVEYEPKWRLIKIGCEAHSVAWWREHWRAVARKEGIIVDERTVAAIEAAVGE